MRVALYIKEKDQSMRAHTMPKF